MFLIPKNRLKDLRKQLKMTQAQLGKELSVTSQAYSNYENGKRELNFDQIYKLSKIFGVTPDYLMGFTDLPFENLPPVFTTEDNEKGKLINPESHTFSVVIVGQISFEAKTEIENFVDYIKVKYGYR